MTERLVELDIQQKSFHDKPVLSAVRFDVRKGEIVTLVGPSGCGKSTLLRIVCGLESSYRGDVRVLGKKPRVPSSDVALIFQEPRLLPWLSVVENVGFALGRGARRDPHVRELLVEVGLADYANAYPKLLSGGMAQRAALARGLFTRPSLLLLDEPFSAVDPFTRMRLQDLLLAMTVRHATTVLAITHDVGEAVYLSDRVLVLSERPGRLKGEVNIDIPRPRERHSLAMLRYESELLALLDHEFDASVSKPIQRRCA